MRYLLRLAEEADVPGILEVYAPYVRETVISFEYEVPSPEVFLERFRGITARFPWLVCTVDGEIAGFAYAGPAFSRAAYQWDADVSIYIGQEYHGQGMGRRLYETLEGALRMQGYYTVYAVIARENEKSVAFHRAMGFEEFARFPRTGYKHGRWVDLVWLQLRLIAMDKAPKPPRAFGELDSAWVRCLLFSCQQILPREEAASEAELKGAYQIRRLLPEEYRQCSEIWDMDAHCKQAQRWYAEIVTGIRMTWVYTENGSFLGEGSLLLENSDPDETIPGRRVYLSRLVVKASERGRGIGSLLTGYLLEQAKCLGYTECSIGVDKSNTAALNLYRRYGFTEVLFEGEDEAGPYYKLLKRLHFGGVNHYLPGGFATDGKGD